MLQKKTDQAHGGVVVPRGDDCPALSVMSTAFHEAGHAVVAHAVWPKIVITSASIIRDETSRGRVTVDEADDLLFGPDRNDRLAAAQAAEADAIFCLAGYMAEAGFWGGIAKVPYQFEGTGDSFDARDAASEAWYGHADEYWGRTEDLLEQPEVGLAIVQVAVALLRRLTLSGEEVEAIVAAAGVRPDPCHELIACEDEFDDEAFSWERF